MQRRMRKQVLQHAQAAGQVFFQPLAGHIGHAGADGVGRGLEHHWLAVEPHAAGRQRLAPEQRAADGFMPGAAQAHQAQHLTAAHGHVQRAGIAAGRALELQHRRAWRRHCRLGHAGRQGLADDQVHQLGFGGPGGGLHRHQLAVAHHGGAVAQRHHLVEPVRHIDQADALVAQAAQHAEQALHVAHRQAGRRLVQHQQPGLHFQRAADGQQGFFGPGEREHPASRRDVAAHAGHHPAGGGIGRAPVDQAVLPAKQPGVAHAQAHVLGHRHPFHQAQVLVDEGHRLGAAVGAAPLRLRQAVDEDLARIGRVDAGQQLDQRGLAGAVFTQQGQDLAGMHVQRQRVHRLRAAKALADAREPQQWLARHRRPLARRERRAILRWDGGPAGGGLRHAVAPRVLSRMR